MSNLKYVADDEEFKALMSTASDPGDIVVVDIFTTWCGPCKAVEPAVQSLALKYPDVLFLKVDADKCFETAMAHSVVSIPLFVIYSSQKKVSSYQGAQKSQIDAMDNRIGELLTTAKMVSKFYPKSKPLEVGGSSSGKHVQDNQSDLLHHSVSSVGKVEDISKYLDENECKCINDLGPSSFDGFIGGKKLISGKGSGKLVLFYAFKEKLMLHSFKIKGKAESGPKVMRFFINHPEILDFTIGSQLAPSQEVTLNPHDLSGDRQIEFRAGSFNLVSSLQIFITEAMLPSSGHHRVEIDSLQIFGAPVILHGSEDNQRSIDQHAFTSMFVPKINPLQKIPSEEDESTFNVLSPLPSPPIHSDTTVGSNKNEQDDNDDDILNNIHYYHHQSQSQKHESRQHNPSTSESRAAVLKTQSSGNKISNITLQTTKKAASVGLSMENDDAAKDAMVFALEQQLLQLKQEKKRSKSKPAAAADSVFGVIAEGSSRKVSSSKSGASGSSVISSSGGQQLSKKKTKKKSKKSKV